MFQAYTGGKFAALCVLDSDVDTLANSLKEGLLSTAEEVLGRQKKVQPWVTNEFLDLCDQRRQLKQEKHKNTEARLGHRERNDDRKQQGGLQHPQLSHKDPTA